MEKRYPACFSIIGRGNSHSCIKSSFCQNLREIASRNENASAAIAKSVLSTTPASPSGTIHLKQPQGGYPFLSTSWTSFKLKQTKLYADC